MKYKRILLKLSGESLLGSQDYGIDPNVLAQYAQEVKSIVDQGVEVAIVIGGGNIFRGCCWDKRSLSGTTRAICTGCRVTMAASWLACPPMGRPSSVNPFW